MRELWVWDDEVVVRVPDNLRKMCRPCVDILSIHVQALKLPAQQREIILAQHIKLLIWHEHKTRKRKLPTRHVTVSPRPRHESETMGSVGFSIFARTPRSTSDDLSLEYSSSIVRVS
jgi:hypothetical protein